MARENMPPLYLNIMDALPSDFARDVFLWATERPGEDRMCYRAEAFAREADCLVRSLGPLLNQSSAILATQNGIASTAEAQSDLMAFILKRHANWRFGGNVTPDYASAA